VATHAKRPLAKGAQVEAVGAVTIRAGGISRMERPIGVGFLMAARASERDLCGAFGMRIVAPDTVALVLGRVCESDVLVASRAGCIARRSNRMGFVAVAAIAVLGRRVLREDLLSLVAGAASKRSRCRERVRLMATGARIMAVREGRRERDSRLLTTMTLHASRRLGSELVPTVAVDA
jgi:hypothetical protein